MAWRSFLIAAAALKTPTRNVYNAQGVNLTFNSFVVWKGAIEAIHRDVVQSFANFNLGKEILKQVLTQLLLYYTRFLDLLKHAHPRGPAYAQYILSIPTLMNEIKQFSGQF